MEKKKKLQLVVLHVRQIFLVYVLAVLYQNELRCGPDICNLVRGQAEWDYPPAIYLWTSTFAHFFGFPQMWVRAVDIMKACRRNVPSWIRALRVAWVQIYRLCVYTEHPDHKNPRFPHSCHERFGLGPPNISQWDSRVGLLSKKGDSVLMQDLDPLLLLLGS